MHMSLYKYVPQKYIESITNKGEIYFRNLSYFKKFENQHRNDIYEGMHRDNPDNPVTIQNITRGTEVKGNYTFINKVNCNQIFIYCLSKSYNSNLFRMFESNSCIEIFDVTEFSRRLKKKIVTGKQTHKKYRLLQGDVVYYQKNKAIEEDITNPYRIPFLKDKSYEEQDEYRFVFGFGNDCLNVTRQVASEKYKYEEESKIVIEKTIRITIGSILDIAKIHNL